MRDNKMLKRSDLIVRGLFLAVIVIGGIVGRLPLETAPAAPGLGAPLVAADIGPALPEASICRPTAEMPAPAAKPDGSASSADRRRHVLSGSIRSSVDCAPVGGAKIEFWPSGADTPDDHTSRAMLFADANGKYRLQCEVPAAEGAYIYLRVTADGYATFTTQYQPNARQTEGEFDIVLQPGK
jgi:hypothetical protein